jgi:acyl-homoserine-lactone acylase
MAHRSRTVASSVAVLVVAALVAAACSSDDGGSSEETSTTVALEAGPKGYAAEIRRTTDGVPHIRGASLRDASFGQGWASGEDHGCTLADQVLKVTSTRARWLGPGEDDANVDSDFAWAALGIADRARAEWTEQSQEVRELITAFADGWNAQLEEVGVDGLTGWCRGAEWVRPVTPEELYLYARTITLQASGARLAQYLGSAAPPESTPADPAPAEEAALAAAAAPPLGSNGWAIGSERSAGGGGMLVANPHFPWEGELRFWEVHLTVPGQVDAYGAQLIGLPGLAIGFTEGVAWTHTVSAGNRFTAYILDLAPGRPTSYLVDGEEVAMTSREVTVEVRGEDGTVTPVSRTLWETRYGPVLDFPGIGWGAEQTVTYRDANIDNSAFVSQYLAMLQARDLDDLRAAHERYQGVPLFNTIAVGADGSAWYADTSATPNLSPEAIEAYLDRLESDFLTKSAGQAGAVLLDGSTTRDDWVEAEGARSPGLVPYSRQPMVERRDYLFNANDSFWLPNADHFITGDYSPLHGRQETVRSVRTRENAEVLRDVSPTGPSGDDGRFDLAELRATALLDRGYPARVLRDDVVARCRAATGAIDVPEVPASDNVLGVPAATIDVAPACDVLEQWDGTYDVGARGAALWREFIGRFEGNSVWAGEFDPAEPVDTPAGLAPAPADGPDPVLVNLARSVQVLGAAGVGLDAELGSVQIDGRVPDQRLPVPGGLGSDGVPNVIGYGTSMSSSGEQRPERPPVFVPRSQLSSDGTYRINQGTSFLMAVEFTDAGPRASSILTYGQTGDAGSPLFTAQVRRFAAKDWKDVRYTDAQINEDPALVRRAVSG